MKRKREEKDWVKEKAIEEKKEIFLIRDRKKQRETGFMQILGVFSSRLLQIHRAVALSHSP